ncbi:MAG: hypothetical protein PHW79_10030 [Candidatus Marinimicrobia bacterium]|nr:hypothetical protein [Candidatus Neomarinimicrobiota bacterium]
MKNLLNNFLRILGIEMDDLKEDIELMIGENKRRNESGKITNYVLMENMALFQNELHAIGAFQKILDQTDTNKFTTIESFIDDVKKKFREVARTHGYAEAGIICIERKIGKVMKYVMGTVE